jgi:hypothetical protein
VEEVGRWRGIRWKRDPELRDVIKRVGHLVGFQKNEFAHLTKLLNI